MGNVTKPMVSSFVPERQKHRQRDTQKTEERARETERDRDRERQIDLPCNEVDPLSH